MPEEVILLLKADRNPIAEELTSLHAEIRALGLERHVVELEADGFTVLPPHLGLEGAEVARMRDLVLSLAERRSGIRPDLAEGSTHTDLASPFGQHLRFVLTEDPAFEQLLLHTAVTALMRWLLGDSHVLSSYTTMLKGPGSAPLQLHTDSQFVPSPLAPYAQVANATFILTDYSQDSGSLCFVPGSHRWCRQPEPHEAALDEDGPFPITSVNAPAGSLVVWHGNTWHGAYPRRSPGLRVNLVLLFSRLYLRTREDYRGVLAPEVLARHPERFSRLVGEASPLGWRDEAEFQKLAPKLVAALGVGRTVHS